MQIVTYVFPDTEVSRHFGRECKAQLVKMNEDGSADLVLLPDPPRPGETDAIVAKREPFPETYKVRNGVKRKPTGKSGVGHGDFWVTD